MFWGESAVEGLCRKQGDMAEIIAGYLTSTLYLKFLCKFSRIFCRVCKFRNGGVAGYAEYSGLVQSGK